MAGNAVLAEAAGHPRVLVIEDDAASVALLEFLLKAFGCETFTSYNGEDGLAMAQQERPDLVICDIHLPRASGYDVVRELKSRPDLRDIPVVAVTAYAMVGDRERALSAGFDGYIPKPIEPQKFVEQVQGFLSSRMRRPAIPTLTPPTPQEEGPEMFGKGVTVLAVDDHKEILLYIRSVLEPHGYTVHTASGVRGALASIRAQRPDIVLSDVHMQDGTGHDIVQALATEAALASIPVILTSATGSDEVSGPPRTAPPPGCVASIFGPLEPAALLDAVRSCSRGGAFPEQQADPLGDEA